MSGSEHDAHIAGHGVIIKLFHHQVYDKAKDAWEVIEQEIREYLRDSGRQRLAQSFFTLDKGDRNEELCCVLVTSKELT